MELITMGSQVRENYLKGLFDLGDQCLIEIQGKDARPFLNGILTNNIVSLKSNSGCYALFCTPKGKVLADLFCYSIDDRFIINCRKDLKAKILELLRRYIVIQKVEINDVSEEWGGVLILDSHIESTQKDFTYEVVEWEGRSVRKIYKHTWGYSGYEWWSKEPIKEDLKKKLNILEMSPQTQEILRIESLTPSYGIDFNENTLPQEANLMSSLNFEKGCYVGQETIARLQNLGHVNKRLVLLKVETNAPVQAGTKILSHQDSQEIGVVTSSCISPKYSGVIAMGYVRYANLGDLEFKINEKKATLLNPK